MTGLDWTVLAAGTAALAWVNWYFFLAKTQAVAATASGSTSGASSNDSFAQEATITVRGGYSPAVVRAKAGQPVRLTFDRQETSSCSEEVVFADFGIRRFLPANKKTVVEVTPPKPGTYEFACGMGMLHGKLVAE
jgi:plastocyanin domain-containing protein